MALRQRVAIVSRLRKNLPKSQLIKMTQAFSLSKVQYGLPVKKSVRIHQNDLAGKMCQKLQVIMNDLLPMLNNKKLSDRYSIQELHGLSGLLSINQMTGQMILMEA